MCPRLFLYKNIDFLGTGGVGTKIKKKINYIYLNRGTYMKIDITIALPF